MTVAADFFLSSTRNWRARLTISVDMMRELSRYTDPDETYHAFARRMAQLYPTTRQITLSRRSLSYPNFRVTRFNLWTERINPFKDWNRTPLLTGGLFARLLYADEPIVIDELDVAADDPAHEYVAGQGSLLAIPLFEYGTATSMLIVTREETAAFPREQVPELVWMTNLFGRAVQTMVLTDRLKELYQAAEFELKSIADLQHSLLPRHVPQMPGLDIAVHYQTVNRAGGDYYDFFPLSNGRLGILIADVSGHGTPAAVLMSICHSLAHSFPVAPEEPGRFLAYLNNHLAKHYTVTSGHFITAVYAICDPMQNLISYAIAGHPPPRLGDATGHWKSGADNQHLPLGVSDRPQDYPVHTIPFTIGVSAVLFTDGIHEALNPEGEPFGLTRLDQSLSGIRGDSRQVVMRVIEQIDAFVDTAMMADDRTLLVIRRS